jgi:hypothetical protein
MLWPKGSLFEYLAIVYKYIYSIDAHFSFSFLHNIIHSLNHKTVTSYSAFKMVAIKNILLFVSATTALTILGDVSTIDTNVKALTSAGMHMLRSIILDAWGVTGH